jgi:eukaryotic-like serine/threonine-protein kinase
MSLVGTTLDDKFRIDGTLASGAGGDVYEATHLVLGVPVAVKVLRPGPPETGDIRRKRFLREARVAAGLRTEHVVRIFDVVAPEAEVGPTYIVMELLQGETLAQRVERVGPLPVAEAVDFVLQACRPLVQMHAQGIVHRDVKPSNLFLARDADGKESIKLLDFGVAAFQRPVARDSSLTFTEAMVGTPRYMAPEQVQSSKNVDARADVWALGITLYEMLAGTPPFDGQTVLAVLNQIERQEPLLLAKARPEVPPELATLVHACLAKDPAGRPASAQKLAAALEVIGGPRSGSVRTPAARRLRMSPRWIAAGAVVMAALAIVVVAVRRPSEGPAEAATPSVSAVSPPVAPPPVEVPASTPAAVVESPTAPPLPSAPTASLSGAVQRRFVRPAPRTEPPKPAPRKPPKDDDRIE